MSVLNENQLLGASAAGGDYEIEQSLRFDDGRGSYLSWTPASAGNRKTWTWSGWVKRGNIPASRIALFEAYTSGTEFTQFIFQFTHELYLYTTSGGVDYSYETTAVLRDPSAWYHIVVQCDTTLATQADRFIVYLNGERQANTNEYGALPLNLDLHINSAISHKIGKATDVGVYLDGYLGEVNFIDGQALTPDSFGESGVYGEWKPIAYAGTYGTNGFYLPFKQDYSVEGFSTVTYEATQANQYIGGTGFQPDFIWFKNRTRSSPHRLVDAVRGIPKTLSSDTTGAEATGLSDGTVNRLVTGLTADGFTLGMDDGGYRINSSTGDDIVAWCWDMGGTTASNTSGSITSSVRANTTYGQSIVSYTGTGSAATIGHGLASAPTMIIVKNRSATNPWWVYTATLGAGKQLRLNDTNAEGSDGGVIWNNTAPTSSVFSVNTNTGSNGSGNSLIAYCFHDVANYSKFGSYSGSGSAGKAITLGFAPAFVMIKSSAGATNNWNMYDNTRKPVNPNDLELYADLSAAETDSGRNVNFTSTGFELDTVNYVNNSGVDYIYMAFADTREYAYWLDQSGNNNDWTSEGGLTESDVMVDSPTNNFCTFNPLAVGGADVLSEGNLKFAGSATLRSYRPTTMGVSSGKFYFEGLVSSGTIASLGVCIEGGNLADSMSKDNFSWSYDSNGKTRHNLISTAYGATYTTGDIIGAAFDVDAGTIIFYKNGVSQGSYSMPTFVADTYFLGVGDGTTASSNQWVLNCGQDSSFAGNKTPQGNQDSNGIGDFYYAPPTGFLALCTSNLPSVDVIPSEHFNTVLYTGNGSTQSVTGVGFQPDFTWIKARSAAQTHGLFDSNRGVQKLLQSNTSSAELTSTGYVTSFNSDGITIGGTGFLNGSGDTFVNWNWKAGGTAVSNTNGTITSSVSANPSAGFSIVSYTGTGVVSTVGHGLSKAPDMLIVKGRDAVVNWFVYHSGNTSAPETENLRLNLTNATADSLTYWNDTLPTSSVFTLGTTTGINASSEAFITYAFHSVDGYSKVGSYTGNGSADGPMVHCGFKPAWVMIKRTDAARNWIINNNKMPDYNVTDRVLFPNLSNVESDSALDFVSNGFKIRNTYSDHNVSGGTYIFLAFAESPFKHSNAR